ncbi:hypothetical protein SAMN05443287_102661 [Micromonospora phaseoli]|uniref:Uncharacterized protein n=1 Tax=Micromonospora phaseoli TaxID=1144548 RepID=A0A1H6VEJ2_9ACTN|nr:hypothetical protein CLV64_10945 [Micromonospora phaseoli]SEJ03069.1 hypothetical protein SAMN05443287_102661 [Micromonospora phaseoli]
MGLNRPAPAALPGASTRSTVPSTRVWTVLAQPDWARMPLMMALRPLATTSPVRLVTPLAGNLVCQ